MALEIGERQLQVQVVVVVGEETADDVEDPVERGKELPDPDRIVEEVVAVRVEVVDEASAEAGVVVVHHVGIVSLRAGS